MITQWNAIEDDALQSLPLRAQVVYLRGLRRFMNYNTGIVGGSERRISLKMLGEVSESINNRQRVQPNKKEVIVSLDQLKAAGLIERIEDKDFLVFLLPRADLYKSVQNNHGTTTAQPRHNHGTDNGTAKTNGLAACEDKQDTQNLSVDFDPPLTTAHISNTDNQISDKKDKAKALSKKTKTSMPVNFAVSDAVLDWYRDKGYQEPIEKHMNSFILKCQSHDYKYINWDSALKNAITDDWAKARQPCRSQQGVAVAQFPSKAEAQAERNKQNAEAWLREMELKNAAV